DLKESLQELGFQVPAVVASPVRALRTVALLAPDLVLMDIMLRGQRTGITAARQIGQRHGVPVVFLTAYADDETIDMAKRVHPAGYLVKPYSPRELKACIEIALYRSSTADRVRDRFRKVQGAPTVCAWCQRVHAGSSGWQTWADYFHEMTGVACSHGICPTCLDGPSDC
ncbi:MAG: response regulator, partial [Myxococcota bacterium]